MEKFIRPENLTFPQIYHTFKAKDRNNEKLVEYRIQDLLEEDYERALDLMMSDFVPEENLCLCRGIENDPLALNEIREFWSNELKKKISIACYDESNELVGFSTLSVVSKNDCESADMFKSEKIRDIFDALHFIAHHHNVFEKYNVDQYLTDYGMVTSKNYRKRGIATEFLKARISILKALKLSVTSTVFTVIGSQKAAVKANYDEVFSIKWLDVGDRYKGFDFTKSNNEFCKILDFKI